MLKGGGGNMRKIVVAAGIVGILASSLSADALKNSLSKMIHEKETMPGMVDLSGLDRPAATQMKKTRSSNAVIATVNGHKIRKKAADNYLKERTKGKVADFDLLPKEQRKRLIRELALPILIADKAKKELSEQEKEGVYVSIWMRKQAGKISVPDEEVQARYDQLKQRAVERNTTNNIIPPFESIKNKMKAQMVEKKIMEGLMKDVEIKVAAPMAMPPMMLQKPINNTTN
jgi:hypothetical protein